MDWPQVLIYCLIKKKYVRIITPPPLHMHRVRLRAERGGPGFHGSAIHGLHL